jgi:hypothetical protein
MDVDDLFAELWWSIKKGGSEEISVSVCSTVADEDDRVADEDDIIGTVPSALTGVHRLPAVAAASRWLGAS